MKILNESVVFAPHIIANIEKRYNAKFVCDSPLKTINGGWSYSPWAIFYTEVAHPQGSNYFGMGWKHDQGEKPYLAITNGIAATEPFSGLLIDEEIVYSRHVHDFRPHKGVFIDGGRDYVRWGGNRMHDAKIVKLQIVGDHLEVVDEVRD